MKRNNNKKAWTLSPFFILYTVAMFAMAFFSVRWNIYVFIIQLVMAIVTTVIVAIGCINFGKYIRRIVKSAGEGVNGVNHSYLESFSIPIVVAGKHGDVVWYNSRFQSTLCSGREAAGDFISQYIQGTTIDEIIKKEGADVVYGDRKYTVLASLADQCVILYYIDNTYYKDTAKKYIDTRPAVAVVVFDNKEEFERDDNDEQTAHVMVTIENLLQKWAAKYDALLKRISDGRYLVILEEKNLEKLIEDKFSVLQNVKDLNFNNDKEATISIGIGRGGESFKECELWARKALEMALGRGGDQVALKTADSYRFFGGASKGYEKTDKVRTRVIASTLSEQIKAANHIILMGHKNSDLDCVGAAIGLWSAATKALNKPAHVVVRQNQTLATPLIESFISAGFSNIFMEPEEALEIINDKTLLIIVDTHSPAFLESEEIYKKCRHIVVIDHHRMMVNHISNSIVFFHETFASSTAEMATELVQYMGDDFLTKLEANALLAGITLDTKNFVLKTGVRTFEAAAYLKQRGADTVEVKRLFSNSIESYKAKYSLVSSAEIYNLCAITSTEDTQENIRLAAAQAADELLSLQDVKASFVMFTADNCINISARSLGDVNVQLIMEQLGGGGHQTMAGAQVENKTMAEVREKLIKIISGLDIK
ncbi:MAG: DHH family phosphoesterase [Acutalibacteraceae bacterium]